MEEVIDMVTINTATLPESAAALTVQPKTIGVRPSETRPRSAAPAETARTDQQAPAGSKENQKVDLEELAQAVDQLENVAKMVNRSVHFRIRESGEGVQVLVVNDDTDEVIREIPPDAVIELAERIQGTLGLLIDKVV